MVSQQKHLWNFILLLIEEQVNFGKEDSPLLTWTLREPDKNGPEILVKPTN
jgi:hypothetical protein